MILVVINDWQWEFLKRLFFSIRNRKDIWASQMRNDCERFFEDEISMYTDIDGKAIMSAIKKRVGW